jgi:hypothetical protein
MLRTILYPVFFIFMGALFFAMLMPIFYRGNTRDAGRIAAPFVVIVFGSLGIAVERSENRRLTLGNTKIPPSESPVHGSADEPGGGEDRDRKEKTYDY